MLIAVTDDPAEPNAFDLAFQSLESALQRHMDAREQMALPEAFASAAETLWWIYTIDDRLRRKELGIQNCSRSGPGRPIHSRPDLGSGQVHTCSADDY